MARQVSDLHFMVFPYMAQGHMIPLVDICKLLAQRGAKITIVTTPVNAAMFEPVLARAKKSGLNIQITKIRFPSEEVGLPKGFEQLDSITSFDYLSKFMMGIHLLGQQIEKLFEELTTLPDCIISDVHLPSTFDIANKYKIPRITFLGTSCISLLCTCKIKSSGILDGVESRSEKIVIPDFPDRIELFSGQVPDGNPRKGSPWRQQMDLIQHTDLASYGTIVNTYEELESAYVEEYKKIRGGKVWCVGPVSLCNKDDLDKAERGSKASVDQHECIKWLDSFEPSSVLYVCLGSTWNLPTVQLIELALGLEASNRPFMWVVSRGGRLEEFEKWNSESGYEERVKGRGFLIRGWAPQVVILSHPSVGGFLTHCGWNSVIEGITSGVPLFTWPLLGDQFINGKLVVQVAKVGVSPDVDNNPEFEGLDFANVAKIKREDVKKAIDDLFMKGGEGEERRQRAKELQKLAVRAVEKDGSSYNNVTEFIEDILQKTSDAH